MGIRAHLCKFSLDNWTYSHFISSFVTFSTVVKKSCTGHLIPFHHILLILSHMLRYPYPLYSNRAYNSALQVISEIDEEGSINNFYRLKGRWEEYESLGFNLIPDCVRVGSQYTIKMRVRVNHDDTFKKAFVEIRYHSPINDKWDHWRSSQLPTLGGKRWVDVEVGFLINDNLGASDELQFRLANTGYADGKGDQAADIDYDDISISLAHGPVRGLVVPESALTCWGEGSDVLITSHTSEWDNEQLAVVAAGSAPLNNGSGMAVLRLEGIGGKAIRRPLTVKDTARTATEVALLSRNIKLTTDDEGVVGGYMQIYGTTGVAQTLEGVEISNFGQKDIKNRYVSIFLLSILISFFSLHILRVS